MTDERKDNKADEKAAESEPSEKPEEASTKESADADSKSESPEASKGPDPLEGGETSKIPIQDEDSAGVAPSPAEAKTPSSSSGGRAMIEAKGLSKFYGNFAAIRDVSFEIAAGQVVAFLGPNGAGKSTTMKILTGYLSPSSGSANIAGLDVARQRIEAARRIGYMPENGPLYVDMTPQSLLQFFGSARGYSGSELEDRVAEVVRQCHLEQVIEKPISKLSRGYRQRVGMAQAFLHSPDVLILDEPTSGLDPNEIRKVRENIRALGEQKTILLSTHILQEVEAMASRVIFIHDGRIVFDGNRESLLDRGPNLDACFASLTGAA